MEIVKEYPIPKVIHYFWLSGEEKPESVKKCIESWKKNCPDFEIKEWNSTNYDSNKHPYTKRAYADKKWAFVSDYGRLDVLYQYGGIYLDSDVEVLKDLSPLCSYNAFMGFENSELVDLGQGFGCVPGLPIIKEMMESYNGNNPYELRDGKEQYIECPRLITQVLLRHGLKQNGLKQTVGDVEILPVDYMCPLDFDTGCLKITPNTLSIHHYAGGWYGKKAKIYNKLRQYINRCFGISRGKRIFVRLMLLKDSFKKLIGR